MENEYELLSKQSKVSATCQANSDPKSLWASLTGTCVDTRRDRKMVHEGRSSGAQAMCSYHEEGLWGSENIGKLAETRFFDGMKRSWAFRPRRSSDPSPNIASQSTPSNFSLGDKQPRQVHEGAACQRRAFLDHHRKSNFPSPLAALAGSTSSELPYQQSHTFQGSSHQMPNSNFRFNHIRIFRIRSWTGMTRCKRSALHRSSGRLSWIW